MSISYTSPISLDCISSTKKVAASGQKAENTKNKAWEIKNFNNRFITENPTNFFYWHENENFSSISLL